MQREYNELSEFIRKGNGKKKTKKEYKMQDSCNDFNVFKK